MSAILSSPARPKLCEHRAASLALPPVNWRRNRLALVGLRARPTFRPPRLTLVAKDLSVFRQDHAPTMTLVRSTCGGAIMCLFWLVIEHLSALFCAVRDGIGGCGFWPIGCRIRGSIRRQPRQDPRLIAYAKTGFRITADQARPAVASPLFHPQNRLLGESAFVVMVCHPYAIACATPRPASGRRS